MEISLACGSIRLSAAEPGRGGGCGWVVSGGSVLEGDLLSGEPFQFGDELTLAADRGEPVVPVGAGVGETGCGVGQQVPGDDQQ